MLDGVGVELLEGEAFLLSELEGEWEELVTVDQVAESFFEPI